MNWFLFWQLLFQLFTIFVQTFPMLDVDPTINKISLGSQANNKRPNKWRNQLQFQMKCMCKPTNNKVSGYIFYSGVCTMWPHYVILNGNVCILTNKIMPWSNRRHVDFVAYILVVCAERCCCGFCCCCHCHLFRFVLSSFYLVKYICGFTLKACQTFGIGFAESQRCER